ncbi:MAG: hypothetical protein KDE08_11020 [Rhodobacteraceae bacterium]|nr:hypothetical protein [Paracoccaceae bacterium]
MSGTIEPGFERFLVEDVILTLGNLRGTLAWVLHSEAGDGTTRQRAWLERIDRQIETLEERARHVFRLMPPEATGHPSETEDLGPALHPVFRSRRAAYP